MQSIRKSYAQALKGITEKLNIKLPDTLTAEVFLQESQKRACEELEYISEFFVEYKAKFGYVNTQDPLFSTKFSEKMVKFKREY